jgi:hypothetical protein
MEGAVESGERAAREALSVFSEVALPGADDLKHGELAQYYTYRG